jgi:hypothetical protein
MEAILEGRRPTRPAVGFTDYLWETVENCWQHQPKDRPSVDAVLKRLDKASRA